MIDLEELKRLESKAQTGPWRKNFIDNMGQDWTIASGFGVCLECRKKPILTTHCVRASETTGAAACDEVDFIVALRNAFPAIVRELEELRKKQ